MNAAPIHVAGPLDPLCWTLDTLLQPIGEANFFADDFERNARLFRPSPRDRYLALVGEIDVWRTIDTTCTSWGEVSLAKSGETRGSGIDVTKNPTVDAIRSAFNAGYTVVINDLQTRLPSVALLCRRFERAFCCRANVNLYYSPSGSQGLDAHYDDDDVFVLQLSGTKGWTTYDRSGALPLRQADYALGPLANPRAHDLQPGDMLYIPRGMPHEACARNGPALHITISLNLVRWSELAIAMIAERIERVAAARKAIPPDKLRKIDADVLIAVERIIGAAIGESGDPQLAAAGVQRAIIAQAPRIAGAPDTADGKQAKYRAAPDQLCAVRTFDDGLHFDAIGAECVMPLAWEPLASWLLDDVTFTRDDLCAAGIASDDDIVRDLIDAGIVVALA